MVKNEAQAVVSVSHRNALSACVAIMLGITSPTVFATVFVNNCNDTGAGSLRSAVGGAPSGETVDASALDGVCSKITLKTGAIDVSQASLTIIAAGASKLSVTAKLGDHQYGNRIFTHTGSGVLSVQDITLSKGYVSGTPGLGGCVYSKGSVSLKNTVVTGCTVKGNNGFGAQGGGIYATGSLTMKQSTVTFNRANGGIGVSFAGGSYSHGFRAYYSLVAGNEATNDSANGGAYGGVSSFGAGNVYIFNSTIALNSSNSIGGVGVRGPADVKIVNSTISTNTAFSGLMGGVYLGAKTIQISNSTIAANTAKTNAVQFPAGLAVGIGYGPAPTFVLQSSIVANNLYGSPPSIESDLSSKVVITGSNNLVQISNASLPADTIVGKCAYLGPLRDNGGLTPTQALRSHSLAIDTGNNAFGATFDQRGPLTVNGEIDYPRISGPPGSATPRADIGAFEVNRSDAIFDTDFESC